MRDECGSLWLGGRRQVLGRPRAHVRKAFATRERRRADLTSARHRFREFVEPQLVGRAEIAVRQANAARSFLFVDANRMKGLLERETPICDLLHSKSYEMGRQRK